MTLKTLTSGMNTAVGAVVTRPGYLVRIDWTGSVVTRYASLPDVTYASESYLGRDVRVKLTPSDARGQSGVAIRIGNDSEAFGALIMQYGFSGKRVRVWQAYATGTYPAITVVDAPVLVFDGEGGTATIDPDWATIAATMGRVGYQLCPRLRINAGSGFKVLLPAGTKLTLGGQTFVLERRR